MKPIFMVLGLILAAGAGAVGGIVASPRAKPAPVDAFADVRTSTSAATQSSSEVEKRMQALSLELSGLQSEIAALRDDRTRASAATEARVPSDKLAVVDESTAAFAAQHKDAILKVMADERAAQELAREEERKQRDIKMSEGRADRAAQKLSLTAGQRQALVDYYAAERTHIDEVRAQFRDGKQETGNETMREAFRDGREWRTNELTRIFGTDLGAQINEFENDGFRNRAAGVQRARGGASVSTDGMGPNNGTPPVPRTGGNR
ncbi:MAG: hypothetical protein SGI72_17210 [Planctomycetota bacterium]|nr:hypothetical protein [Planctomycetota bacterium]